MKKAFTLLLVCICVIASAPLRATDQAPLECDYDTNRAYEECAPVGYGADKATHTTISMSMLGWGLGLAIAIAIVAGIIHQSAASHSDSSS